LSDGASWAAAVPARQIDRTAASATRRIGGNSLENER
jgi:hypothetical protein